MSKVDDMNVCAVMISLLLNDGTNSEIGCEDNSFF